MIAFSNGSRMMSHWCRPGMARADRFSRGDSASATDRMGVLAYPLHRTSSPLTGGTPIYITGWGFPSYDGIGVANVQVAFGGVLAANIEWCSFTGRKVESPLAVHPGPVDVIATVFLQRVPYPHTLPAARYILRDSWIGCSRRKRTNLGVR